MPYMRKLHPYIDILVSNIGEVFVPANGKHKAHWTFGSMDSYGYMVVKINGKKYKVHRLVAQTYIPNPKNLPEVDHTTRDKTANSVQFLRWVTRSQNCRNTSRNDRVDARGGTHYYEDKKQFYREAHAKYNKTHKDVHFADGKRRWIPNSEALLLLALPVSQRIYKG